MNVEKLGIGFGTRLRLYTTYNNIIMYLLLLFNDFSHETLKNMGTRLTKEVFRSITGSGMVLQGRKPHTYIHTYIHKYIHIHTYACVLHYMYI